MFFGDLKIVMFVESESLKVEYKSGLCLSKVRVRRKFISMLMEKVYFVF